MKNKKKIEPVISKHFADLAKKSWAVRKSKLLNSVKKEKKLTN